MTTNYRDVLKVEDITVENIWYLYQMAVIPKNAPVLQRTEMRKSFYTGFLECFKLVNELSTTLSEEEACKVLDRLNKEGHEFFQQMMKEHGPDASRG